MIRKYWVFWDWTKDSTPVKPQFCSQESSWEDQSGILTPVGLPVKAVSQLLHLHRTTPILFSEFIHRHNCNLQHIRDVKMKQGWALPSGSWFWARVVSDRVQQMFPQLLNFCPQASAMFSSRHCFGLGHFSDTLLPTASWAPSHQTKAQPPFLLCLLVISTFAADRVCSLNPVLSNPSCASPDYTVDVFLIS